MSLPEITKIAILNPSHRPVAGWQLWKNHEYVHDIYRAELPAYHEIFTTLAKHKMIEYSYGNDLIENMKTISVEMHPYGTMEDIFS